MSLIPLLEHIYNEHNIFIVIFFLPVLETFNLEELSMKINEKINERDRVRKGQRTVDWQRISLSSAFMRATNGRGPNGFIPNNLPCGY